MDTAQEIEQRKLAAEISGPETPASDLAVNPAIGSSSDFRLHYLDWGQQGSAGTILFLHGGGLNAHTWDVVIRDAARPYRCVALDQRGHGDSEWSPGSDYGMQGHLRDIEGFVDQLKLRRPVLVGQSMGGMTLIRLCWALDAPDIRRWWRLTSVRKLLRRGRAHPRLYRGAATRLARRLSQARDGVQPAARPAHPAPQPVLQSAPTANGKMTWKHDTRRVGRDHYRELPSRPNAQPIPRNSGRRCRR